MAGPWENYAPQAQSAPADSIPVSPSTDPAASGPWTSYLPQSVDPAVSAEADQMEQATGTSAFSDATTMGIHKAIPFADELSSAFNAPFRAGVDWIKGRGYDIGRAYDEGQAVNHELERRAQERSPIASTAGQIVGTVGATAPLSAGGLSFMQGAKPTLLSLGARGAAEGSAYGAAYGLGEGDGIEDRLKNAGWGGLGGGLLGGTLGAIARIGAGGVDTAALPTAEDLKAAAQAAYQKAEDAGVLYSNEGVQRVANALRDTFADFGYHPNLQPGAATALGEVSRIADAGQPVTLQGLDTARKIAGNAYIPGNASNNALASKVSGAIDDLVTNPQAGEVLGGDAEGAADAINQARQLYGQSRKADVVESLLNRGELNAASSGSGANVENATRQQLKRILTNDRLGRGFTEPELEAVRNAVIGTPGQNLLRWIGKFSPESILHGGVGMTMGAELGGHLLGPEGATAGGALLPAVGFVAKKFADAGARNAAKVAQAVVANGGSLPQAALSPVRQAIVDAMARAGAQQLPAYTGQ